MDQTGSEQAEIVLLSQQLAALLENLEQMLQQEKPYLVALYQSNLGELEYRLLGLQIECRALKERIELATRTLNQGETLTQSHLDAIEEQIKQAFLLWQVQLNEQAQALSDSFTYLNGLVPVDVAVVSRAKKAYRRLARLLHPDVSPKHQALFEHYWPSVQDAYRAIDADLLEALLHVIETTAIQDTGNEDAEATKNRLIHMIAKETERLLTLRNDPPFCWAEQLQDAHWLNERRAVLDLAIQQESERWAALTTRYVGITAQVNQE
ncbi:MAG: J domain-containing protein [Methylicorpusculum sp.]|uniref:J domain-containing protein n=1 Tax=Methylicorpusculum sp. TaxID=2713644 RepID=UPI002726840C|nr:J domain-containing protein [Methylicorpusculum sp.]MDO8844046.1 J domain-containing protein [Methylicorpusculum sp.]MDO8938090.1 J domain-containing protein [Methylicorpusculum sp.]MDP2178909.1 J domain-containing protein [Methylicorpusculum sp.]MDP3530294.1 J domain-containing protein [Methylicorpusculum sp.]